MIRFAVSPGYVTFFKPEQLAWLATIIGEDAKIEPSTNKCLYIEMQERRMQKVKEKLTSHGMELHPCTSENHHYALHGDHEY